jgi:hypothetical protein
MKTIKLFFILVLIGTCKIAHTQTNVYINGQLTNTNGAAITVILTLYENGISTIAAAALTDSNGFYTFILGSASDSGNVVMEVIDCNSNTISDWGSYSAPSGDTIVNIPTHDYCPAPGTACQAYFSINQALDANGLAIPSQIIVTDSSYTTPVTGNLTYTWSFGDGSVGTGLTWSHTYSGNGPYLLCLTINDGQGCSNVYCDTVSIDAFGMLESEGFTINLGIEPTLSVEKNHFTAPVNIYPNPALNFFNIELKAGNKVLNKITVFDLSGKIVYENNNTTEHITTINTENIAPGTYLIRILFDNEVYNQKVIIR